MENLSLEHIVAIVVSVAIFIFLIKNHWHNDVEIIDYTHQRKNKQEVIINIPDNIEGQLAEELQKLLQNNRKIEAVKLYRAKFLVDLKTATIAIDDMVE